MATSAHFPVNTLALKRGGLVKAVRERASALAASGSLRSVTIDVLSAQPRLAADVAELKDNGHLHPDVRVRSVLAALDDSRQELREPVLIEDDPDVTSYMSDATGLNYRLFRDGIYERYVRFNTTGKPVFIDHFSPARQRVRREELDGSGRLYRVLEYQAGSTKATVQRYIGRNGKCFLTVWQKPGEDSWGSAFVHAEGRELKSTRALYALAYERLLATEDAPALCTEFRENLPNLPKENLDDVVRAVRHPNLLRIITAHSNHLQEPYVRGSGVSRNWQRTLNTLGEFDFVVALTPAQKADLAAEFGNEDIIRVIGQVAPAPVPRVPVDPQRLVLVARTHPKKRVDEAMRVFARVREQEPDALLEVFGFGYQDAEEAKVKSLISDLGIGDGVRFMPFTDDPRSIYGNACATLLTSASEGFPLILLESMSQGVPVMAYDSNYGPRDVINDGENGYLVPFGDHEALAERIVDTMRDPAQRERLGRAAQARLADFEEADFLRSWLDLLSQSPRTKPTRTRRTTGPVIAGADWEGEKLCLVPTASVPPESVLEFRERGTDRVVAAATLAADGWNVDFPARPKGTLLDVFVAQRGGAGLRIEAGQLPACEGPTWRLYATANGYLSAKAIR